MGYRNLIVDYYSDCNNLVDTLSRLCNSYRLLVGAAGELNQITLAKKSDVKKALKRAEETGELIDEVLDVLEHSNAVYLDYCNIETQIIKSKIAIENIKGEIDEALKPEKKEV